MTNNEKEKAAGDISFLKTLKQDTIVVASGIVPDANCDISSLHECNL